MGSARALRHVGPSGNALGGIGYDGGYDAGALAGARVHADEFTFKPAAESWVDGSALAHGRGIWCDHCDRGGTPGVWPCMSKTMLAENTIKRLIKKQTTLMADMTGDRDEGRYAMYRGVVAWEFSDPLGAGNRVRLPMCVVQQIRRLFPNPRCGGARAGTR